ncbi:MAG: ABC transporter substrate-binding protein [Romboutsia sp.]|nr:ABC transporter substrate-binding protein [Romboutsia sp.]
MKKFKIIAITLAMVISLVGCSMDEDIQGVLESKPSAITSKTINLTMMQPETINPITNKNKSVSYIMNLVYDGLFTIDENYNTVPQLVDEYKVSNDGMSINIKLKDAKWHDGTSLTSSDVRFTVDLIKKNIDSPYNALVENISSISIASSREFTINFNNKYAFSVDTLIFPIISEKQLGSVKDINEYRYNLVGNGVYKIKEYNERKSISLIVNDSYHDKISENAKNIEVEIVPDEEAQVSMVMSLDSDIAKISLDDLSKLYEKEFKTTTYESRNYECLLFNYNNDFFKNVNFRKALVSSIDKNKILEEGYINNATLINFPLNSKSKYYDKEIKGIEYNSEKAKEYLSKVTLNNIDNKELNNQSTVKDNNKEIENIKTTEENNKNEVKKQISKLNLKIIVNKNNAERVKTAYIINDNLKEIGIKSTIQELSDEDMSKAMNEGHYDIALVGWELSVVPDAANILNNIGYSDEKLANYIESLRNATSESQIDDIYKSIQRYVNNNALFMSLVITDDYIVTNRRIEGKIVPNSFNIYEGITNLNIAK